MMRGIGEEHKQQTKKGNTKNATNTGNNRDGGFSKCSWKRCPGDLARGVDYSLDGTESRTATSTGGNWCTVAGDGLIPLGQAVSWGIRIVSSNEDDGEGIAIGVAPFDVDPSNGLVNLENCGWYFDCWESTLSSGPPHNCRGKAYGPRREEGQYVQTGETVGVVLDTARGDLSFVLHGKNLGVAYEGIPLNKPLVPCVILMERGCSVELTAPEAKEKRKENGSGPAPVRAPSNVAAKSALWDSITLTWNAVKGASFYQVETDGGRVLDASTTVKFHKRGFLADTEHAFRVRAVRGSEMGEWSDAVTGRTEKETFGTSGWKDCPKAADGKRKYTVAAMDSRLATKEGTNGWSCAVLGNTPLPPNSVVSWWVKVVKSRKNNCGSICVGVAPADAGYGDICAGKCGWCLDCGDSTLHSGPPHSYAGVPHGPRKLSGKYLHQGDSAGVVVDTEKGVVAFLLKNMDLGAAYWGVPLDRPLVPCVLVGNKGDSVELVAPEVKEIESKEVPVPANIATKSASWDSITLSWAAVKRASFYQVEVDGSNLLESSTENVFTKTGIPADSEHTFRVRVIRGYKVGEWSDVVKGRTQKEEIFEECCAWKECPDDVAEKRKYSVYENNARIATKMNGNDWCTIIGNIFLPPDKITSWSIRILKSRDNDGGDIYVGIAPSDIDQNGEDNYEKCGWYFDCFSSELLSGPPHNYNGKDYGPRKVYGEYVQEWDSVGVVMDSTKGELSFTLNGVSLGIAFEGVPLDKPLVPCVILRYKDDSVEFVI